MNSSISRQLVFWLAVPLTLLALGGVLVHYFNSVAPQVISADHRLKAASAAVAAQLQQGAAGGRLIPAIEAPMRYAVRDQEGRLLYGDARLPSVTLTDAEKFLNTTTQVDGHGLRILASRVDTPAGARSVVLADELKTTEPAARFGFMSTLLWDFVQLDLTLALVWVGIQLGLRPVKRLRDEIAARSPLDLRPIVESAVPREIAPVAATLNRLFALLRTTSEAQQQFIANTAHQLRTPITGMLAQLDLLMADPAAVPIKHRLATLQDGVKQLSHAANQLLTLARADPAVNVAGRKQNLDLAALAGEAVAKFFDRALQNQIDLGADLAPASVQADPSLIDDLLNNLVDNALKYTPAGGKVTVYCGLAQGRPFLAVEDNGPGIPEAERRRVRQRYYRLPNSPGHGSGLGLAIVDEIATLHDAELSIEGGGDGRGTRVTVAFGASAR